MKTAFADGKHWPIIIIGLLVFNAGAVGYLIQQSGSGRSHAVVPDYYEKAVHHDTLMAQERTNLSLGWEVTTTAQYATAGATVMFKVVNSDGAPLAGAVVAASGFHRADGAARVSVEGLAERAPGSYAMPLGQARPGLWQFAVTIDYQGSRFTVAPLFEINPQVASAP